MLSGKPPFHSGDIKHQILNEEPEAIEGVPKWVNGVLMRALGKEREGRFGDVKALYKKITEPELVVDSIEEPEQEIPQVKKLEKKEEPVKIQIEPPPSFEHEAYADKTTKESQKFIQKKKSSKGIVAGISAVLMVVIISLLLWNQSVQREKAEIVQSKGEKIKQQNHFQ